MQILDETRVTDFISCLRQDANPRTPQFVAYFLSAREDVYTWRTIPTCMDTTLNNLQIAIALSMRLLEPLISTNNGSSINSPCIYNCPACNQNSIALVEREKVAVTSDIDPYGYHTFRCSKFGMQLRTKLVHDVMVSIWVRALKHAGFIVTTEPRGHFDHSDKRPDACWEFEGHFVYVDFRTCDPLIKSNVFRAGDCPGFANSQGQIEKDSRWYEMIHSRGDEFIPLCQEYPGMMGDSSVGLLNNAASRFSSNARQQMVFKEFWLPRLHMAFIRGTADMILKSLPTPCFTTGSSGIADTNLLLQTESMSFLSARAQGNICA